MMGRCNIARTAGTCMALLLASTVLTAQEQQDQQWMENSPYYEPDAWYDITEWFDGNDYNPVDESQGEDEEDWYESTDDYTDWGYDDQYDNDDWFYDYYDDGYSTYYGSGLYGNNAIYPHSWRYFDYDQDGFYDAYEICEDTDNDGIYDRYDYHPLGTLGTTYGKRANDDQTSRSKGKRNNGKQQGTAGNRTRQQHQSSQSRRVSGTIANTKEVKVRDNERRVVKIKQSNGRFVLADLGPSKSLQDVELKNGMQVTVSGPMTKVGERRILLAQKFDVGNGMQQVHRQGARLEGTVSGVRSFDMHGHKRELAILDTGSDRWLLDLGREKAMPVDLTRGEHLAVHGIPFKKDDQQLLLVQSFDLDGKQHKIDRDLQQSMSGSNGQSRRGHNGASESAENGRNSAGNGSSGGSNHSSGTRSGRIQI